MHEKAYSREVIMGKYWVLQFLMSFCVCPELNGRGGFVLIDGASFTVQDTYAQHEEDVPPFG